MRNKNWINIAVREDTHEDVLLLKIQCKAKNADAVIKRALTLLKKKLRTGK